MPKLQKPIPLFMAVPLLVGVWVPAAVPATAEAIQGKLTIESSLGGGTSVTLRLPKQLQGQSAR